MGLWTRICNHVNKIQVLQNKAAKLIRDNFDWNISASPLVKSLGWFSARERRDYFIGTLMYRCLTNNAPVHLCGHFNAVPDVHFMALEVMSTGIYMYLTSYETLLKRPCSI